MNYLEWWHLQYKENHSTRNGAYLERAEVSWHFDIGSRGQDGAVHAGILTHTIMLKELILSQKQ